MAQQLQIGVFYFPTDYGMDAVELARALEERGFESLFLCEHTHIPTSRRTPFPAGGELPKRYVHTHDPFVTLSFIAAATKTLKLGTGICLMTQRDPIITAKMVASLDQMSGGRFVFGVGGGWNREEMEDHGTRYETRFRLLRERLMAMKALWTEDEAEFHGEFVDFDPAWCWPKPAQRPACPSRLALHAIAIDVDLAEHFLPQHIDNLLLILVERFDQIVILGVELAVGVDEALRVLDVVVLLRAFDGIAHVLFDERVAQLE